MKVGERVRHHIFGRGEITHLFGSLTGCEMAEVRCDSGKTVMVCTDELVPDHVYEDG